jgi:hypothetical protein
MKSSLPPASILWRRGLRFRGDFFRPFLSRKEMDTKPCFHARWLTTRLVERTMSVTFSAFQNPAPMRNPSKRDFGPKEGNINNVPRDRMIFREGVFLARDVARMHRPRWDGFVLSW